MKNKAGLDQGIDRALWFCQEGRTVIQISKQLSMLVAQGKHKFLKTAVGKSSETRCEMQKMHELQLIVQFRSADVNMQAADSAANTVIA